MSSAAPSPAGRAADPGTAPEGRPARYQRSLGGMIGAMVVLLVVVAAFVLLRDANRTRPQVTVEPVDYASVARAVEDAATYPLLRPRRLPEGWRATSATFVPQQDQHWHLGVLTDEQRYIGLEQARRSVPDMVESHVDPAAEEQGTVEVGGQRWRSYRDDGGDNALVRRDGQVTTLVVGRVPVEQLAAYLDLLS